MELNTTGWLPEFPRQNPGVLVTSPYNHDKWYAFAYILSIDRDKESRGGSSTVGVYERW